MLSVTLYQSARTHPQRSMPTGLSGRRGDGVAKAAASGNGCGCRNHLSNPKNETGRKRGDELSGERKRKRRKLLLTRCKSSFFLIRLPVSAPFARSFRFTAHASTRTRSTCSSFTHSLRYDESFSQVDGSKATDTAPFTAHICLL